MGGPEQVGQKPVVLPPPPSQVQQQQPVAKPAVQPPKDDFVVVPGGHTASKLEVPKSPLATPNLPVTQVDAHPILHGIEKRFEAECHMIGKQFDYLGADVQNILNSVKAAFDRTIGQHLVEPIVERINHRNQASAAQSQTQQAPVESKKV